ncbi:hypothetical protein CJU89_0420 [Yarrowia sp. B02]|nr:hypothetical protein CJU89_0420 [Yarrowia sp. B02]
MDSDYGFQSILSDDEPDAWDEIDAPFLERPSSSGLVMPTISGDGSVVSSREMSNGDGFLNGEFPIPIFAQSWGDGGCLCNVPLCGCDKVKTKIESYFGQGAQTKYVVVFEGDSETAKMAKLAVLKHREGSGRVTLFMDTQFELSKDMVEGIGEVKGVEVVALGAEKEVEGADFPERSKKMNVQSGTPYAKVLFSIAVIMFILFNRQESTSVLSSNVSFSGPPQPVSPFNYEIPKSMIFPSCHFSDKPETHVSAQHHRLDSEIVYNLLSEGFQRFWNGLKNFPSLLSRLLGLDKDVFETNSERTLRKIELDMDLLVELLDEILEEQTPETLHDALYIWNKMGSDIAEPLKRLKYDEKTTSANFLTIIRLEKRLKVVGEKLASAKKELKAETKERTPSRSKSKPSQKPRSRQKAHPSSHKGSHDYMDRMEDRDQQSHERRGWRKERREGRRAQQRGGREEIW